MKTIILLSLLALSAISFAKGRDGVRGEWHELKPLAPTEQNMSAWGKALGINGLKISSPERAI